MIETIRYKKPSRFPIGKVPHKNILLPSEVTRLLRGRVVVEEKLDGTPKQFETQDFVFFTEDLRRKHSIYYLLPGRYAIFDVYDRKRNLLLCSDDKRKLALEIRSGEIPISGTNPLLFFPIPVISKGLFSTHDLTALAALIGISAYGIDRQTRVSCLMEGIVVKPDRDLFPQEFVAGKIVRTEFEGSIVENYLRGSVVLNEISPFLAVA